MSPKGSTAASLLAMLVAGCLFPRIDFGARPASPFTWYARVPLESGANDASILRAGRDVTAGHGPAVERLGSGGETSAWRNVFEPVGRSALRTFAAAAPLADGRIMLVASEDRARSVAFVVMRDDGSVERAAELPLETRTSIVHAIVATRDGAVVAIPIADAARPTTLLVRVDATTSVSWSRTLADVSVATMAFDDERGLVVSGTTLDEQTASLVAVASFTPDGDMRWLRDVRAPALRPGASQPSVAIGRDGHVALGLALPGLRERDGASVVVAALDATGTTLWSRVIPRPLPDAARQSPLWVAGPLVHGVSRTPEGLYVTTTLPADRPANTRLALFELDASGEIKRQRTVPHSTATLWPIRVVAGGIVVRGEHMTPCLFPKQSEAQCGGPEQDPRLKITPGVFTTRERAATVTPGPKHTQSVTLRPLR